MNATNVRAVPITAFGVTLALVAAGCSPRPASTSEPIRPVKTVVIVAGGEPHTRSFPGKVEAAKRVELAFQVSGLLVDFPVREGQKVAKGDLIGQLRQDEFKARLKALQGQVDQARAELRALKAGDRPEQRIRLEANVRAADARLANARAEFNRYQQLLRNNAASRADFDVAETSLRVAEEDRKAAQQLLEKGTVARQEDIEAKEGELRGLEGRLVEANLQLEDSTLKAPYDGVIAKRFVEPNQNIRAKEPIVRFQDIEEIEIAVDVPESVMAADIRSADILGMVAEISGAPGIEFPVQVKEVAQAADPVTQTFRVRVGMKAPEGVNLLPGMTSTVTVNYRRARILGDRILIPISAVFKEAAEPIVWIISPEGGVTRRPVKLGAATGSRIEVADGLQAGDRIAVAGVTHLRDGMKVRDLGDALGGAQP